jgi:hypothetical protein
LIIYNFRPRVISGLNSCGGPRLRSAGFRGIRDVIFGNLIDGAH